MEDRAAVLPGLPRSNPVQSYWQDPPDPISDLRTSKQLPESADYVIVGSGISGACIAHNILQAKPNANVVMLEARQAASGASGRNGGHTKHASYRTFMENHKAAGKEDAMKIAQLEYDCMVAVHDFIEDHNLSCDSKRCDTVDIFYDKNELNIAQEAVQQMKSVMGKDAPATDYRFYNPDETAQDFLTPNSLGSVRYAAGSLSAYKLTVSVLEIALSNGLNLQTTTPALSIRKSASTGQNGPQIWHVETPRDTITTSTLILATNGYTSHLYPELQGVVMPFRGIVTAHRPGQNMPQTGLPTTYSFIYDKGYDYMITRPAGSTFEGDIVIGGGLTKGKGPDGLFEYGNTDDTEVDTGIADYLKDSTKTFFGVKNWGPDHPDGRVRRTWSGIMGYSADGYPLIGPVPGEEGLFLDVSFQGHGMVLCFLCAKAVTKMILGQDESELDKWFPNCFRVSKERMEKKFGGQMKIHKATELAQNGG